MSRHDPPSGGPECPPDRDIVRVAPGDPETRSPDLCAENLNDLRDLFPEVFADGKIDFQVLRRVLGDAVDDSTEKFGLSWHGKQKAHRLAFAPSTGALRPAPQESVDWSTTKNILVEGDNLEVLKLLLDSYSRKVKMIYIDPPYNTGKDFIYRDAYSDTVRHYLRSTGQLDSNANATTSSPAERNGRFHTAWLNMLYPRLLLARRLLTHDGVIFISIDDAEVANLRSICDEIFGPENLCGVIKRRAARKTAFLSKRMTDMCDYVVIYAKSDAATPLTAGQIADGTRPVFNMDNPLSIRVLRAGAVAKCADGRYGAGHYAPRRVSFETLDDLVVRNGTVKDEVRIRGPWRINQKVLDRTMFVTKNLGLRRTILPEERGKPKLLNDLLDDPLCYNEKGSEELRSLLGGDAFTNPKPTGLIRYLVRAMGTDPEMLVLDFFAGSGSTAHAVMLQNADDGGRRRTITVQLPEPVRSNGNGASAARSLCEAIGRPPTIAEITKERLRRAGGRIRAANPGSPPDTGFRLFKLDTANFVTWDSQPSDLQTALFESLDRRKADRSEDDLFYGLLLALGHDLCAPTETRQIAGKTIRSASNGLLIACLAKSITRNEGSALADEICAWASPNEQAENSSVYFLDHAFPDSNARLGFVDLLRQGGISRVRAL